MPKRRGRGEGGLHWDAARERWIATAYLGFDPSGRRISKRGSGRTKTEAKAKLREVLRDKEDGLAIGPELYTVGEAVRDWLSYGLSGRDRATVEACTHLCTTHLVPDLGKRRLRELSAEDVDRWLARKSTTLSTRTLQGLHSCLNRSVKRAMARDKVKRNVVELCSVPTGRPGRPSKSLNLSQAHSVLEVSRASRMHAYIVLSLLTGARTEEMRALVWDHVDLIGRPDDNPPVPPHVEVWRSVRKGGDTKTRKSRRTLALPQRCVDALVEHEKLQERERAEAGGRWQEHGLVFASKVGTPLGPVARPTRLPHGHPRDRSQPRSPGLDAARVAAQLRVVAVRPGRTARGHLPAGRPQQHRSHRAGLPQADSAGPAARRRRSWTRFSTSRDRER